MSHASMELERKSQIKSEPKIICGGMGVNISNWSIANSISKQGELGVVSGTALDVVLASNLQMGDEGGHMRRAISHFPFQWVADRILNEYFIEGGKDPLEPFKSVPVPSVVSSHKLLELTVMGNFVNVWLAKEGHNNPVGINYLEKIQMPLLPSFYGAMLAGADRVLMGAGIPIQVPDILKKLSQQDNVTYDLSVEGANKLADHKLYFDPQFMGKLRGELAIPQFYPITSSLTLPKLFINRNVKVDGFIVEGNLAGGHNASPRGKLQIENGEPVYGPKDDVNLVKILDLGYPVWLAGGYNSPEKLKWALDNGATGIQTGSIFALCNESGMDSNIRNQLLENIVKGEQKVITNPRASPTGYPFKIAELKGSISDQAIYEERERICDRRMLCTLYEKETGDIGYRCPSEPEKSFVQKGGSKDDTEGKICLCNHLATSAGMPQIREGVPEASIVTLGKDLSFVTEILKDGKEEYSAKDALEYLKQDI